MSDPTIPASPETASVPAAADPTLAAVQAEISNLQAELAAAHELLAQASASTGAADKLVQVTGAVSLLIEKYKGLRDGRYIAEGQMRSNGQVANANVAHAQGDEANGVVNDLIALLPSA